MGKVYEKLTDRLREFVTTQPVFFAATPRDAAETDPAARHS